MSQQHLLVALAVIVMVTNALGFGFTMWKNHHRQTNEKKMPAREPAHI